MAGGILNWLDRGNQRAMDDLRSNPDAGFKLLPYAKSESARRRLIATSAVPGIAGLVFGWIGAVVALVVTVPLVWKLEHHHFFGHDASRHSEPHSPT